MGPVEIVLVALLVVWVLYRQVTGRFVRSGGAALRLPLVLSAIGLLSLVQGHPAVTALGVALVAVELLVTAGLGIARGAAVRLEVREGWLYQRGGAPVLVLWLLTIAVRAGMAVLAGALGAGPLVSATLTLSFGVSLLVQAAVLARRVEADGRPVRPDARAAQRPTRVTL